MAKLQHHKRLFLPCTLDDRLLGLLVPDLDDRFTQLQSVLHDWRAAQPDPLAASQARRSFVERVFGGVLGYCAAHPGAERYEMRLLSGADVAAGHPDALLGLFDSQAGAHIVALVILDPFGQSLDGEWDGSVAPAQRACSAAAAYPECRWVVVANRYEVRLYSRAHGADRYEVFSLEELATTAAFKSFYALLARENLIPSKRDAISLTDDLLVSSMKAELGLVSMLQRDYRELRQAVYDELCESCAEAPAPQALLLYAQTLVDRILFIAVAESCGLLPRGLLKRAASYQDDPRPKPLWKNFRALFRWVDHGSSARGVAAHRSVLFRDEAHLRPLTISDTLCAAVTKLSEYDFCDHISVEMLSHVFEQSMADLEAMRGQLPKKPLRPMRMKHRSEGTFCTPGYVARFLVDQTLGRIFHDKWSVLVQQHQPQAAQGEAAQRRAWQSVWAAYREALVGTRVLDFACGSGIFLVAAFLSFEREYARVNAALSTLRGSRQDAFDATTTILQKNLFGFGMSDESVEITKVALWLLAARKNQPLPNIDATIRRANALIADSSIDPYAFDWQGGLLDREFPPQSSRLTALGQRWSEAFDVIVCNPPYMRPQSLVAYREYLQTAYPKTHHRAADLFVYYFERGLSLLKPGGRLGFVMANKWLRSRNAISLRRFLAEETITELLVDFGTAPFVPGTDVFPCVITLSKPDETRPIPRDNALRVSVYPRTEIDRSSLGEHVARHHHLVPRDRLGESPWSLVPPEEEMLMEKIRSTGVPLSEFAKVKPYYGIKTGLNEAFLIDAATRDQLIKQDPRSAEILKKYVRGQDIARWIPEWDGLWMIFARRGIEIERYPAIHNHLMRYRAALQPLSAQERAEGRQGRKAGRYQWYELQDTVEYWGIFENPKIIYQEIQFYPAYALDRDGIFANNKCFILPSADPWILGVLNSPLMWWHNWRYLPHMKDDALTPLGIRMESLPIAPPSDAAREVAETCVPRLVTIAAQNRQIQREVRQTLRGHFHMTKLGAKLEAFPTLDAKGFVSEVAARLRIPKSGLSPSDIRLLETLHADATSTLEIHRREALRLERRMAVAVNEAYQLTADDVAFLWRTAPPRTPSGHP